MPFIRQISDHYITSNHKEIRLEAIPTILHLLRPMLLAQSNRKPSSELAYQPYSVFSIISKTLWVCVSDPGKFSFINIVII